MNVKVNITQPKNLGIFNLTSAAESILFLVHLVRRRPIERLDLRLNPIGNPGAIIVLTMMFYLPLKELVDRFEFKNLKKAF